VPLYRVDFYVLDGSTALQFTAISAPLAARRITHFANESACLRADNIRNKEVTIHRSHGVLKIVSLYTKISFTINCFVKNTSTTGTTILLALTAHQTSTFIQRSGP
jgi:hypothetical protein